MEKTTLDIVWILVCSVLVFIMQAGFMCLESGLTRTKNSINVAIKNLADFGLSALLFWLFGFGIIFGLSQGGLIGTGGFMPDLSVASPYTVAFFFFQAVFCGTATTIVSGAVAGRMRFSAYLVVSALVSGLVYPFFAHWAWNGLFEQGSTGWLEGRGFVDFAGSTVVHGIGAWVALAGALIVGPRVGRFPEDGKKAGIQPSSLPLAMLGTLLLWIGWFGFNGGSTLAADGAVPAIIVHTCLAGASGLVGVLLWQFATRRKADVGEAMNGALAGLVAITANCHVVSTPSAVLVGLVGAGVMLGCTALLERLKVDDAVGAIPVHGAAGVWGTLAVGLLGDLDRIGTGLTRGEQVLVQAQGALTAFAWAFGVAVALLYLLNKLLPLRVTEEQEQVGLNVAEHGASSELLELFHVMEEHARSGDLRLRAPVQPYTEVGQIGHRYNEVLHALQMSVAKTEAIVRTAKDGIVTFAQQSWCILSANPSAEILFAAEEGTLHGCSLLDLIEAPQRKGRVDGLLEGAVDQGVTEFVGRRRSGERFPMEATVTRTSVDGEQFLTMTVRDITEQRRYQEQLRHDALHDALTGLPNRLLFLDRLKHALAMRRRRTDHVFAVLYLDLDRFKVINDSLGHLVGDKLLQEVAERLNSCVRGSDTVTRLASRGMGAPTMSGTVARLGGDEYALLLEDIHSVDDAICVADRVQKQLSEPFLLDEHQVYTSASIGIVLSSEDYAEPASLLRDSDAAMYRAKASGRSQYALFDEHMHQQAVQRLEVENALHHALERQEFVLYYQPVFCFKTRRFIGFEALIRWQHEGQVIPPDEFVPIAEENGFITEIGNWVVVEACRQLAQWEARDDIRTPAYVSVNLSPKQFLQTDIPAQVEEALIEHRVPPSRLNVELTETAIVGNQQLVSDALVRLRNLGVKVSLDDFGTGFSSLTHLCDLPIDVVKIDRTFVSGLGPNGEGSEIVRAILPLSRELGFSVTAEGIEHSWQAELLASQGCDCGQGYYFSRPVPASEAAAFLQEEEPETVVQV